MHKIEKIESITFPDYFTRLIELSNMDMDLKAIFSVCNVFIIWKAIRNILLAEKVGNRPDYLTILIFLEETTPKC